MRVRTVLILASLMTCACQSERSFDERYEEARISISRTAADMDRDLAQTDPAPNAEPAAQGETDAR